jgi:ankyrin repeat protein
MYNSFQWAKHQLDSLFLQRADEDVLSFLDNLETSLGTTYGTTLHRLHMQDKTNNQVIKSAFQALVGCLRPPMPADFLYIIQNDRLGFDSTLLETKLSPENIPNFFQGLLESNPETNAYQFSHYSVREYLTCSRLEATALKEYHVEEAHAHRRLALLCLETLQNHDDPKPSTPFYDYAASLWMEHAKRVGPDEELDSVISSFLSDGQFRDWRDYSSFAVWMKYRKDNKLVPFPEEYAPFHAFNQALILGRDSATIRLIDNGLHHIRDPDGYTVPIVNAVIHGTSIAVITKMIESGSDIEDVRFGAQTALTCAVERENKELIRFLVGKGADLNRIIDADAVQGSAFSLALLHGSADIVSFLIGMKADLHEPVNHVGTAVQVAVSEKRTDILRILLQEGGDVRESQGRYGTVLHLAVEQQGIDQEDVVRLLLQHGAAEVINETVASNGSALHHAIEWGSNSKSTARVVRLLLEKGADPNLESAPSTNPLHRAILKNNIAAVKALIEKGATGLSKYGPYKTALECAAFAGHERLFREIVGMELNSTEMQSPVNLSRALQGAILSGNFNTLVRILQGGNALDPDEHGWSPWVCSLHVKSDRSLTLLKQGQQLSNTQTPGNTASYPTEWAAEKLPQCYQSLVQIENGKLHFSGRFLVVAP